MEWMEALKQSVKYMEEHIFDDISVEDVARHVNISSFYLQRGFSIVTGYTMGEYLRSRRLYLAAMDLLTTDEKVIDIAYKYCYETPESFTKAFIRFHGVSPIQIRLQSHKLHTFLPLTIKLIVEGGNSMDYRIEKMDAFKVMGLGRKFHMDTAYLKIPKYWDEFYELYQGKKDVSIVGMFGVCIDDENESKEFTYMIADLYKDGEVPEGFQVVDIPAYTWAKFRCVGPLPGALQAVNTRIFNEWLPGNHEHEIAAGINIEMYTRGDTCSADYISEIWIPVKKK